MKEPKEPEATCPIIDSWLKDINRSHDNAKGYIIELLDEAMSGLEEMRDLNQSLRNWGKYWQDRAEELEDEITKLRSENDQ